jgi:non-heme chloroperoxidase
MTAAPPTTVSADQDHIVPWAIANAAYEKQARNEGLTEVVRLEGRGRALTTDAGWRQVADTPVAFVRRFA